MNKNINIKENNNDFRSVITENLLYLRKQKKLTGNDLGDVLGVSRQAYYNYENGNRELSLTNLKILSDFYGVTLDLMVSSSLIDSRPPILSFPTLKKDEGFYKFTDDFAQVTSFSNDLIVVKESELLIKIFETNTSYVKGQELLFEFKKRLYIAEIHFTSVGDGFFMYEGKPIRVNKNDYKSLVYIGVLFSVIEKRYEKDLFF